MVPAERPSRRRRLALARLSAAEIMAGYRRKAFTPRDVIDDIIAALEATEDACNAVVTPMYEQARAEADRATGRLASGEAKGPLDRRARHHQGSRLRRGRAGLWRRADEQDGFVPEVDAAVVSALKAAGAIVTCKTTTCESGYKLTADSPVSGITRNPWNRSAAPAADRAAARRRRVAAGCGPLAIGTDGVGSIRVPSFVLRRVRA